MNEPSVIALNSRSGEVLAMGHEAWKMIGRTPSYIVAVRPLRKGAITDFEVTQRMIRLLLQRVGVSRLNRPRVVICVPSAITAVERRAVTEAARRAGAADARLIEQPVAAAIGADLPINEPIGNMVVDIGGGTTESALISLGQGSPNELIIKPNLFQHIVFDPQAAKQEEFPRSLMGVIAAIRQTLSDAQHYKATWDYYQQNATSFERPAYNQALAALQPAIQGRQPTVMEPGSVLMIDKAVRLGAEFGIKPILVASGQEWRRPDLIKATGAQFIVPLILPKAPKMPSDSDWENVSLGQLRAWDWAPEVPAMLQKNGQPISLTLHGLKDKNHFRANLAKAIERGLAKRDALAALTTAPAKLTGVSDQLGTIETGKLANLVVVEGDYFAPKAKIRGVWIEGIWNSFEPQKLAWIDKKKDDAKKEKTDEPEEDKLIALSPIEEDTIFEP